MPLDQKKAETAENIGNAKKYNPHTYISTKVDLTKLQQTFGQTTSVELFLKKAIQKSYKSITKSDCKINEEADHSVNLQ